jgi:hypothetical protein
MLVLRRWTGDRSRLLGHRPRCSVCSSPLARIGDAVNQAARLSIVTEENPETRGESRRQEFIEDFTELERDTDGACCD